MRAPNFFSLQIIVKNQEELRCHFMLVRKKCDWACCSVRWCCVKSIHNPAQKAEPAWVCTTIFHAHRTGKRRVKQVHERCASSTYSAEWKCRHISSRGFFFLIFCFLYAPVVLCAGRINVTSSLTLFPHLQSHGVNQMSWSVSSLPFSFFLSFSSIHVTSFSIIIILFGILIDSKYRIFYIYYVIHIILFKGIDWSWNRYFNHYIYFIILKLYFSQFYY